ncbi:MAG TPA: hypothetical protein VLE89_08320 [Chlamydiales bacterium]|nr:hypothetical protein [Chlamydiales bacterium]
MIFPFVGAAALAKYALFFSKRKVQEIRAMLPAKEECLRKIAIAALKTGIVATVVAIPSALISGVMAPIAGVAVGVSATVFLNQKMEGIRDAFTRRHEESNEESRRRIGINIAKATVAVVTVGSMGAGLGIYIPQIEANSSKWDLWLPFQSDAVVFIEYALLGLAHGVLAKRNWNRGEKIFSFYHGGNALASIAIPVALLADQGRYGPARLHHSFTGLALQLAPLRTLKCLGLIFFYDSLVYMIVSQGYHGGNILYEGTIEGTSNHYTGPDSLLIVPYGLDNILNDPNLLFTILYPGCGLEYLERYVKEIAALMPNVP